MVLVVIGIEGIARMAVAVLARDFGRMRGPVDFTHEIQCRPHENAQHQQQQHADVQDTLGAGGKPDHCISLRG
ncbi:hypothetical protein ASD72_16375 [Pseudoxanthomonas sp. Root630]|nr:hypothetical protein ASD72_16375 [Pseudoxanthomonas sp. Root630]